MKIGVCVKFTPDTDTRVKIRGDNAGIEQGSCAARLEHDARSLRLRIRDLEGAVGRDRNRARHGEFDGARQRRHVDPGPCDHGASVSVDVTAVFAAGNSLEDDRKCVDEINEFAVGGFTVGVTAIAGEIAVSSTAITQGATYEAGNIPFHPDEQVEPAAIFRIRRVECEVHVGPAQQSVRPRAGP